MFDIGWTEIVVVIIVACFVFDIKDISSIIKLSRSFFKQINNFIKEAKIFITDIEHEGNLRTNKITDLEGKKQVAYDVEKIMPKSKNSKNKNHDN